MRRDEIESLLERGFRVGFVKPTEDPEYLGWILLSKHRANERILEAITERDAPPIVAEEKRRRERPYLLLAIELRRTVHESGDYETERDFRQNEKLWFSSLHDVAIQLSQWGYSLEAAREAREIDAP